MAPLALVASEAEPAPQVVGYHRAERTFDRVAVRSSGSHRESEFARVAFHGKAFAFRLTRFP